MLAMADAPVQYEMVMNHGGKPKAQLRTIGLASSEMG